MMSRYDLLGRELAAKLSQVCQTILGPEGIVVH